MEALKTLAGIYDLFNIDFGEQIKSIVTAPSLAQNGIAYDVEFEFFMNY
jgi:hypothetical protein